MRIFWFVLSGCFLFLTKPSAQSAQFATAGTGHMRNYICWFDWAGQTIVNNSSTNFTTADGLNVTITFSNVYGPAVEPWAMNTWSGAVLWQLYDFADPAVKPALFSRNTLSQVNFTMTISATREGVPTPFTLVAADAEGSDNSEKTTFTTNGTAWRMIEFFRNSGQTSNPLTGCGTQTASLSLTYGGAPSTGQNPILATDANGSLIVKTTMDRTTQGGMAVAFGIFSPIDRGDLPSSYMYTQHGLSFTSNNSCNFNAPFPSISQAASLRLGSVPGDADGAQALNDNTSGADEDAVSSFPLYDGSGNYSLNVNLRNTTGSPAYLTGWFDYNRDGKFSTGESVSVTIPNGATMANLKWIGLPPTPTIGAVSDFGFRFRLASNTAEVQNPDGYAKDGEVEDYLIAENSIVPQHTAVQAGFTAPDTVCVNTPVTITNTSIGASSYYWNFCVADMNVVPSGTNLGNIGGSFSLPVFMDYAFYNGNYYGFLINHNPGSLIRLDFGNSLLNTPTAVNLGNFGGIIPTGAGAEGIQVVFNEGNWYAIIVGGWPPTGSLPRVLKVEFGPNLNNPAPTATNWGNLGNMAQPIDLHVFEEGSNWYGFTVNAENNTITRFNFTNSFSNTPTAVNLGNIGNLAYPTGIYAINDNGFWRVFIVNAGDNTRKTGVYSLSRLDFGSSLLNTPTGMNLGNPGNLLQHPRDLTIMKMCDQIVGFVVNGHMSNSDVIKMNFNNDLSSTPSLSSLGVIGNSSFPHSISKLFRVGNDLYSFITNVDNNTITRLKFNGCSNSSIPNSNLQNPPSISYNTPGTYSINLTVDDGLPTQVTYCKQVTVMSLTHSPTQNFSICQGASMKIGSSIKSATYSWNTGATTDSILINAAGTYWVESSQYGCTMRDSLIVKYLSVCDSIKINGSDKVCTLPDTITYSIYRPLNCTQPYSLFVDNAFADIVSRTPDVVKLAFKQNGRTMVKIALDNGCKVIADSINITIKVSPTTIDLGPDISICRDTLLKLEAQDGFDSYLWQDGSTNASFIVSGPGVYSIVAQNLCGTRFKDTVNFTRVVPSPFRVAPNNVAVCKGDSIQFTASGGSEYHWQPVNKFKNPAASSSKALIDVSEAFSVQINDSVCLRDTIITIPVIAKDIADIRASKRNDVNCTLDSTLLTASGGVTYTWKPNLYISRATKNQITVKPPQTMTYYLEGKDAGGCIGGDSITVYFVNEGEQKLLMPNAFTPNNDGLNDVFRPIFTGPAIKFDFKIFNRWGQLVFQTSTPGRGWDGRFNSALQPKDVYVYYITAEGGCNGKFKQKGTFVLIR